MSASGKAIPKSPQQKGAPIRAGKDMRALRQDWNWSQKQLADPLEISKSRVQALESSSGPVPKRIAIKLNALQAPMPRADCKLHRCALIPRKRPWRRGTVNFRTGVCPIGGECWAVGSDGSVSMLAEKQRAYNQAYYLEHSAEFKDRAKKQRQALQRHVSREELKRLRIKENRLKSLRYGPEGKNVCLECGWIGDVLTRHTRNCPEKAQSSSA